MRNMLLIAKREYLEQVRGRSFRISTALVPLLLALLIGGDLLFMRHAESNKHIAIAATDPKLADAVKSELLADNKSGLVVDVEPASEDELSMLRTQVRNQSLDGLLMIDSETGEPLKAAYLAQSVGDIAWTARLKSALRSALVRQQLLKSGMSEAQIDRLFREVPVETLRIGQRDTIVRGSGIVAMTEVNLMFVVILMPILLHGMDMARSIIEEKSSRIFEVMLAVTRPEDSLSGKLLGTGAVGLTQVLIWVAVGAFASGSAMLASTIGGGIDLHLSFSVLLFFVIYFVLGFLLYSAIFSGLGATCDSAQDLQMYAALILIPVWVAMFAIANLVQHPGSPWNIAASLFPITSPFVMVPRLSIESVPAWQTAASLAILIVSLWIALRFSARLYRVGILMYGKRATLPEILRWLRSA